LIEELISVWKGPTVVCDHWVEEYEEQAVALLKIVTVF
jgi:hypothetical protein